MNDKVRALIGIALGSVKILVPGAAPAVDEASAVVLADHPVDALKDPGTELDSVEAAFKTVENLKGVDIGNEAKFRGGAALVEQGLLMMHEALIDHTDGTPAAQPQADGAGV